MFLLLISQLEVPTRIVYLLRYRMEICQLDLTVSHFERSTSASCLPFPPKNTRCDHYCLCVTRKGSDSPVLAQFEKGRVSTLHPDFHQAYERVVEVGGEQRKQDLNLVSYAQTSGIRRVRVYGDKHTVWRPLLPLYRQGSHELRQGVFEP